MSKWIWKFGEFEIFHNLLLHNRRLQYGYRVAPVWKIYSPETVIRFSKEVNTPGGEMFIKSTGYFSTKVEYENNREERYEGTEAVLLEQGKATIRITVSARNTLPSLYVEGIVETDESWFADDLACLPAPVGYHNTYFCNLSETPDKFPFCYEAIPYNTKKVVNGGTLFDFGKETFAKTSYITKKDSIFVSFGESPEEALDLKWSVIHMSVTVQNEKAQLSPQAFRYIFVDTTDIEIKAQYEYLPLEYRGSFKCNEDIVNRVWDVAAYTFHLNSREFFLDGIKRDRWVWSGDAYQSLFVNRYLFFDSEIEQRTLIALGGKKPFEAHINTIMDYTYLWIMAVYEHYITYGDIKFLHQIFPQIKEVIQFCRSRTDGDGFVRGRQGDWVFIDWAPMDKTGALCGEQILYYKALEDFSFLCAAINEEDHGSLIEAQQLQRQIRLKFYNHEKGVFVDSFESGKNNISRHSNILALLFLPLSEFEKKHIYTNVILNDEVRQITTPYFKFYENQVHCEAGNAKLLETSIREYYGSMLENGATSLYEEYNTDLNGVDHYAMYGHPYEKSLCHAWSCSTIYLLGRYRLGVKNTGVAYDSFEVAPYLGNLQSFSGTVPLPGGEVTVTVNQKEISVLATINGGTLIVNGKTTPIIPGIKNVIKK